MKDSDLLQNGAMPNKIQVFLPKGETSLVTMWMPRNPSRATHRKCDRLECIDLKKANQSLDAAIDAAYGVSFHDNELKIVAHLFKLYAQKTGGK